MWQHDEMRPSRTPFSWLGAAAAMFLPSWSGIGCAQKRWKCPPGAFRQRKPRCRHAAMESAGGGGVICKARASCRRDGMPMISVMTTSDTTISDVLASDVLASDVMASDVAADMTSQIG
jgi:hypothetical protein